MARRHRSFKEETGHFLYGIIALGILWVGLKLFGVSTLDYLALIGIASFLLVGFILRKTGFRKH